MSEPVAITKKDLAEKVEQGWKKDALAEHYGLPVTQMTKALKQAGLTIRKFHKPKFVFVEESEEETTTTEEVVSETNEVDLNHELVEELVEEPLAVTEEAVRTEETQEVAKKATW